MFRAALLALAATAIVVFVTFANSGGAQAGEGCQANAEVRADPTGHLSCVCNPGFHPVKRGLGGVGCVSDNQAPPPPENKATCANLLYWDKQRTNANGRATIARTYLAVAQRDLANALAAGHYDAASRVAQWTSALNKAMDDVKVAQGHMTAISRDMREHGQEPGKCPGISNLPSH